MIGGGKPTQCAACKRPTEECRCREEAIEKFKQDVETLAKSDLALGDKLRRWAARQVKAPSRASPVCCVHCEGLKEALRNTPLEPEQIEACRRLAEKEAAARAEKGDTEDGTAAAGGGKRRRRSTRTSSRGTPKEG
jgi:hypothetical protein